MEANFRVSGRIIRELSEQLPTNIIAINELIKNSYDANAKRVKITLDSTKKILIIDDNGDGMDIDAIKDLIFIANSTKKYGEKNKLGRYIQGSKGLGFLSVFKFGKIVHWITKTDKNIGLSFTMDYDIITNLKEITSLPIHIEECKDAKKGTKITIELDDYNIESLNKYFSKLDNLLKTINCFEDNDIEIIINIDGDVHSSNDKESIKEIYKERQLFYVTYNSTKQKIRFYHQDYLIEELDYKHDRNDYKLEIEIMIFEFKPYQKQHISPLYDNPDGDLTPLIYVNNNLFNNFTIFNPNIMRNIKTKQVLPQMIGSIKIYSNNPKLSFNSDRSQFSQNDLTDSIKEFLREINMYIQIYGSERKKHLIKFDILEKNSILGNDAKDVDSLRKLIKPDFHFKEDVKIKVLSKRVEYSYAGKKAFVEIQAIPSKTNAPMQPSSTTNVVTPATTPAATPATTTTTKMKTSTRTAPLIGIPVCGYTISFNSHVELLMQQMNMLDIEKYNEVLACSLRAIFDMSVDSLKQSKKYNKIKWNNNFVKDVKFVTNYVKTNNKYITEIDKSTNIGYNTLDNYLNTFDLDKYIPFLNLGAHTSAFFITNDDLKRLGIFAGAFLLITNEMLNNQNIN